MKPTTVSILILFASFRWSHSFTITRYPDLEEDYVERISAYSIAHRVDPLWFESKDKLLSICEELSLSNIYVMQNAYDATVKSPVLRRQSSEAKIIAHDPRYQSLLVSLQDGNKMVPRNLFPCPIKIHSNDWYFGYGFEADIYYLFSRSDIDTPITFRGLIEPSFRADTETVEEGTALERYFSSTMRRRKPIILDEDPLCTLNANQLFRLCSGVNEAAKFGESFLLNKVEHYSRDHSFQRCLPNRLIEMVEAEESEEIRVNVVPCSINAPSEFPSFYLTFNPREENAVFFLQALKGEREKRFKVRAHIRDVTVLKYVMEIF